MKVIITFLSCFIIIHFQNISVVTSSKACFRSLCIPSGYNKQIKPPLKENETNNIIYIDFNFVHVLNVHEQEDAITLKSSIYITWEEPRITILSNATSEDFKHWGILPKEFKDHLWLPDVYIYNVLRIGKYNFLDDFGNLYYLIQKNGSHLISYRIEVEIEMFCKMYFQSYPMDEQVCHFLIGSSMDIDRGGEFFELQNFQLEGMINDYTFEMNVLPKSKESWDDIWNNTYQRTGFELKFKHDYSRLLMSYYVPSGILVILSWVGIFSSSH